MKKFSLVFLSAILLFSAFFGFFTIVVILQRVLGVKLG